jgi:hypothetical protein
VVQFPASDQVALQGYSNRGPTNLHRGNSQVLPPALLQICKWAGALLTGSDPQTEFHVTCSKQTTEKFLTGARMLRETRSTQHSDASPLGFPE